MFNRADPRSMEPVRNITPLPPKPPAQPLFIALTLLVGGDSLLPAQILQTLLFFGCGFLVFFLWRRISGSPLAAGIAAALFVLAPSNAAYAQYLWPEVPPA